MTLSTASRFLNKMLLATAVTGMGLAAASCDSLIYDDQGDCSVHYRLTFKYDLNPTLLSGGLSSDAFGGQVSEINVGIYDRQGRMVYHTTASRELTSVNDYALDVDVAPGRYDIVAWCEGKAPVDNPISFTIKGQSDGDAMTATGASLPLSGNGNDLFVDRPIRPFFHGIMTDVEFPDTYGQVIIQAVPLTKDTKNVQLMLQSIDGTVIDPNEFKIYIEADNSELAYDNSVVSTSKFVYRPWHVTKTSASFDPSSKAVEEVNGLLAEFTTSRLMADRAPKLVVHRNSDNTDVIRINLVEYFLMVKGEYNRALSNQKYLDCMDMFTLMFFLDADRNWYTAAGIYINGWRVVPQQGSEL